MLEQLKERLKVIDEAIQQSIANHNGLLGRRAEAEELVKLAEEPKSDVVVDAIIEE